jgi:hypothetical protein
MPWPQFFRSVATYTSCSDATALVRSALPSSTTSVFTARPHASAGTSETTCPIAPSSS